MGNKIQHADSDGEVDMGRKIDWFHYASSRQLVQYLHEIHLVQEPFSEIQILDLQEKFLTNGFQYLKTKNVLKGRNIIKTFLSTLNLYQEVGCLTLHPYSVPEGVADIYQELTYGDYLNSFETHYIEEYLFDSYFDFIWIEANQELLTSPWFDQFVTKLITMGIDQRIPIVVVVYDE